MAYVVGLLTPDECRTLERRGWELEDPPSELIPADAPKGSVCKMVFVDTSMFDVMSGPDWDTSEETSNGS